MVQKMLKVKDGDVSGAINDFLRQLLSSQKLQALIVPQAMPSQKTTFPVLVSDPHMLHAAPLAPLLAASTAALVSRMTKVQAAPHPIGVVMRSCEIRALLELVKLNQAKLENIVIIGIDCLGTFPLNTYVEFPEKQKPTEYLLEQWKKNPDALDKYLRSACRVCKDPIPTNADIVLGLYGTDIEKQIIVEAYSDVGKQLVEHVKLEEGKDSKERQKALQQVREDKTKKRQQFLKEKAGIKGIEKLAEFFDRCVNCHNCRQACPVCYCKECLFDSSVFDAEAYKFLRRAEMKGMLKMPTDALLFHVGRMNHMILSCVQCGLCEQACPNTIPLMDVFIPVAEQAQKEFSYTPGKDKDEKIPLIVYKEDEFLEVGEK
ncbi:MAG: Coenzyme F420 hydrogenase/dehydrogenase, beta subunit C-terminal domain [Candidatus Thermoplasmatota archaeon]|nr:Coenzyme F420 hydrogenase/dehydrogenase, beta subunit C-terminal domain [Candidatus Thermoplasmatota archaeon]